VAGEFSCYLVGTVKVTAGIIESAEREYISNRVIKTSQLQEIRSGQWVTEALQMMPNVMIMLSQLNTTGLATWDNWTLVSKLLYTNPISLRGVP
jgi:hypothetical protein